MLTVVKIVVFASHMVVHFYKVAHHRVVEVLAVQQCVRAEHYALLCRHIRTFQPVLAYAKFYRPDAQFVVVCQHCVRGEVPEALLHELSKVLVSQVPSV